MKKILLGLLLLILIVAVLWVNSFKSKQSDIAPESTATDKLQQEVFVAERNSEGHTIATPSEVQNSASNEELTKKNQTIEKYKNMGFVEDPENPKRLIKHYEENGKKKFMYVDIEEMGLTPTSKTIKNAEEVPSSKLSLNPEEELSNLKRMDMNLQEDSMLSGNFRDDQIDLEISISPSTDSDGNLQEEDFICFYSPKLNFKINTFEKSGRLRSDGAGYAVLKINTKQYARITWSYEENHSRTLHGHIISMEPNSKIITFTAKEVHTSNGEQVKYCK